MGEYFDLRKGLRQGCVMSPWLFNIYFDRVVREVNEKAMGKGVLTIKKGQMRSCEKVRLNGKEMQEVDKFN